MAASAPRHARPFVILFLALLVLCALAPMNLWPFSNWELFSRVRTPIESSWQVVVVERSGRVFDLPLPEHSSCARLVQGATKRVSVYRIDRLLSHRIGAHAAPAERTLAFTCSAKEAHATS